ncbi:SusC/RagA family TonB-linked outer membrane protein [Sphingobacterium thalpophilum]|uniref:SusC/RagA family TonB-linked outer membrane protein n=1 Tax=Sphingobacterium thalpophilum TaxID=259 RepID=UPI0037DA08B0
MKPTHVKRRYLFRALGFIIVFMQTAISFAQSIINGTIRNRDDQPIAGATVKIMGTAITTRTDQKGSFSLSVERFPTELQVSYVGYIPQTRKISSGGIQNFVLQSDERQIDEVVVVAYGSQNKSKVVGSVVQISADELKKAPSMNLTNALAGRVPGLTALQQSGRPGADNATLYLRGIGTYGGNRSPLVIIDDIERPLSTLAYLDPSEIATISFLKDAVSTAAYGVQAANGIILVKTKNGKKEQTKVSYDFGYSIGQNTRFPKFLNGPDYMNWYNKGTELDNDFLRNTKQNEVPYIYTQELIDAVQHGTNTNPLFGNTDWIGLLADNNSYSQHHAATISGGASNTQYFASVSHMNQDGVIDNTNFKRYNVRTNLKSELNEHLTVGLNIGLRNQNTNLPGISPDNSAYMNPFYQAVRMLPNLPMYAPNGLPVAYQAGAGWVNPIASVENSGYQKLKSNIFQGTANIDLKVPGVTGLLAKVQGAYDYNSDESKSWLTPYATMGRQRDQVAGDFVAMTTLPGITKTSLRQSFAAAYRYTWQASLNYNRTFGEHSIGVLALYEYAKTRGNQFAAGASNFPITIIQEINYGSTTQEDIIRSTGSSDPESARAGFVSRLNYAFRDRYLVELVSRWDASANFAKENRWKSFPAIGLGWVVSNEAFFKEALPFADFFKLKGSIGRTGNDRAQVGTFPFINTLSQNVVPVVVIDGKPIKPLFTNAPQNPLLKWEESTTSNVGFESRFLNGKFGFDFEWFYRYTTGILAPVGNLYPASMGGYFPSLANIGEVDNRGFDAQLRYNDRFGEFKLGVVGNINWARNRYLKLDEANGIPSWQSLIGRPIGTKIGFVKEGMVQTWEEARNTPSPSSGFMAPGFFKFKDLNGDGRITRADDMTYIGRSNIPELTFGLNIDMAYKGFDFSALLQGAARADVALAGTYEGSSGTSGVEDNTPFTRPFYNYGNSPYFLVENSWREDNPNAEFPRLSAYKATGMSANNANANSGWIRKGDYLRLKSVQIGYTFPKSVLNTAKIEHVRVFASGSNLFTWDYLKYLDPEMPNVNNGFYPQQRIFEFGLSVTF